MARMATTYGLDLRQVASRRLVRAARFPQRSANHTLRVGMRERRPGLCPVPQLQPRTRCNNRYAAAARVIYPSHPESDRARAPGWRTRGPRDPFLLSLSLLSFVGQPRFRSDAHLYHRTAAAAELRVETAHRRCQCRGTDRIGLPCGCRNVIYDR